MTDRPIDRAMSEQLRLMRELMTEVEYNRCDSHRCMTHGCDGFCVVEQPVNNFGWPILKGTK